MADTTNKTAEIIGLILKGSELVGVLLPIGIDAVMKFKELLSKHGEDFAVELVGFQNGAVASADHTLQIIEAWKKQQGSGT